MLSRSILDLVFTQTLQLASARLEGERRISFQSVRNGWTENPYKSSLRCSSKINFVFRR